MSQVRLRYENSVAELDLVEPMWNALQEHHSRITPELDPWTPKRDLDDAWRLRRSKYVRWLEDPETFFIIAENESGPIGYAFVTIGPGYASWATGDRAGVLETLSVLPEHRGDGVGAALIEAVWARLAEHGVADLAITTTKTNIDSTASTSAMALARASSSTTAADPDNVLPVRLFHAVGGKGAPDEVRRPEPRR